MQRTIKNNLKGYNIKPITKDNYHEAMEIYNTNQDFFILTEGKEGTADDLLHNINAIPPNFSIENKSFLSFWRNEKIVAILDILKGYPDESCMWIGLLMVHGEIHNQHLGHDIVRALFQTAKDLKYSKIQLGVIENNLKGLCFWKKMGFQKIKEIQKSFDNGTELNIIVMENSLF